MAAAKKVRECRQGQVIDLPMAKDGTTPRVLIIGRGTLSGTMTPDASGTLKPARRLQALRLRDSTMGRVRALVAGPTYLAVEWLLTHALDELEKLDTVQVVHAVELEG